jgi:manganese transport protein
MPINTQHDVSLQEVNSSVDTTTSSKKTIWKRMLSFLGPAYLVSVGYMDPGNWATDIEGGSRYGYALVWVLVMSNLMAIVLQTLCARLGIIYKKDLAQVNRETYPRVVNFCLYVLAEIAIAATDLAEIIGMAIGLKLLFHIPLLWGVCITVLDTFLLLYLQRLGIRKMEAFIIGLIAVIFASFAIELYLVKPSLVEIAKGLKPTLPDSSALYIAIGIIGATVMPHNLYLHSALVQTRKIGDDVESKKKALKWNFIDSVIALNLALFVNVAILVLAAAAFHKNGLLEINSIETAHELLTPLVGAKIAPILFALALIAAGQSSTITGTLAGQIVMEGYLQIRINPWVRRLLTRLVAIVPAVLVLLLAGEDKMVDLLVFSQVLLSVQLAFAIIPLIYSVSNKRMMGAFAIKPWLIGLSVLITSVILYLNIKMVFEKSMEFLSTSTNSISNISLVIGLIGFIVLLLLTILIPLFRKHTSMENNVHTVNDVLNTIEIKAYNRIAVALDFSNLDERIISNAMHQANENSELLLIHVVESAGAKVLGKNTDDVESKKDLAQLDFYVAQLKLKNIPASSYLGYRNRASEIARICKEQQADILIVGAHGHKGFFDILYGETIESVRHKLSIPVLIINA